MQGTDVESRVEIGNEARLGEVEFELAVEFRPGELPELESGQSEGEFGRTLGALRRCLPLCTPLRGEDVLRIDAPLVGSSEPDDQAVGDSLGDVRGAKRPKRAVSAPVAFRTPERPSPPEM